MIHGRDSEAIVSKYGGSSIAEMDLVVDILNDNPQQRYVVVSAPEGITDQLWTYRDETSAEKRNAIRSEVIDRYAALAHELGSKAVKSLQKHIAANLAQTERTDHYIPALGEYYSAKVLAARTDSHFVSYDVFRFRRDGTLDQSRTHRSVRTRLSHNEGRSIIAAYGGVDPDDNVWTLPRNGSDQSAAEVALAVGVDYENWTNVNGIFTADPRFVPAAKPIALISLSEVGEGAAASKVFMGEAVHSLLGSGKTTTIRNTLNPSHPGTKVVETRESEDGEDVIMITGSDDLLKMTIERFGMSNIHGYSERVLSYVNGEDMPEDERVGLSYEHSPDGRNYMAFTVREPHRESDKIAFRQRFEKIKYLIEKDEFLKPDKPPAIKEVGVVYLVGQRTTDTRISTAVHARAFNALLEASVDVEDPVSSLESPAIGLLVQRGSTHKAMQVLHREFFEKKIEKLND